MNEVFDFPHHGPEAVPKAAPRAIRAACVAVSLAEGKTPEELAGEIARRAVAALRGKPEAKASGATQ